MKALTTVWRNTVAVTTVRNADGLATHFQGIGHGPGVAFGALTSIGFIAVLVAGTAHFTDRLTVATTGVQLVSRLTDAGAVQVALAIGTAQGAGGHTIVAMV